MLLLFLYLSLAVVVSFICSIMEVVLLSTPATFLTTESEKGNKSAKLFLKLRQNIQRPLSAILALNTTANTIGAAGVGAQATIVFGEVYFGIVSAILTFLILIFSEIIPKTLGSIYWRKLAFISARVINFMVYFSYPIVVFGEFVTKLFSKKNSETTISREEISAMASIGVNEGIFEEKENKIIQNLIKLKTIRVSEIMTPRTVVVTADEAMLLKDFLKEKDYLHYSRIPVFNDNPDNISGFVFSQTVFEKLASDMSKLKLRDIKRDILTVHGSKSIFSLWELLLSKKEHIALVIDEYGGMDGIVTMEDIIESLLGFEIVDETDRIVDMQQYARERWSEKRLKYNFIDKTDNNDEKK